MDETISENKEIKPEENRHLWKRLICIGFVAVSMILFLTCQPFNGFYTDGKTSPESGMPSFLLILLGWAGILEGHFSWVANPLLLTTWIMLCFNNIHRIVIRIAGMALLLSLSFLLYSNIDVEPFSVSDNSITGYGAGYWLWNASILVALIGSIVGVVINPYRKCE